MEGTLSAVRIDNDSPYAIVKLGKSVAQYHNQSLFESRNTEQCVWQCFLEDDAAYTYVSFSLIPIISLSIYMQLDLLVFFLECFILLNNNITLTFN
jgi:hypothetical protein